ncbi:protease inhibitor I42 family protein [Dehalogenimonas sp. THU2]|uniref:protease inhibitor I42 family protein n=1 Tax=Dehalogenimonas sp. THU2 TaxID=3151121 RepID=UPI0032185E6E
MIHNEKRRLGLAVVAGGLVVAAVIIISSLPAATIIINQTVMDQAYETSNGFILREVTVSQGDKFNVKLYSFPSAGMSWSARIDDFKIVKQQGPKEYSGSSPISTGGPGMEKWVFKAIAEGETTIIMTYGSVGLTGPPARNTLELKVTVKCSLSCLYPPGLSSLSEAKELDAASH